MSRAPSVSVIILNYNGMKYVEECLQSVLETDYPDFEVIFVDNNSTDGSLEYVRKIFSHFPILKIIPNKRNYGFAQGNNIGAKKATGNYIVFLNNDTMVLPDWLRQVTNVMNNTSEIGAAQCKILLLDKPNLIDSAGIHMNIFGISMVRGHMEKDVGQYDKLQEIFAATGAALVVRRHIFREVGGFDADFFMINEEDDLCWRIWLKGYRVVFVPKAMVYHRGRASRSKEGIYMNLYYSRRNRIMTLIKNYSLINILRYFPIFFIFLFCIGLLSMHKCMYMKAFLRAVEWNAKNLKRILQKRATVQRSRAVSDDFLFARGIIRKPYVKEILKGF